MRRHAPALSVVAPTERTLQRVQFLAAQLPHSHAFHDLTDRRPNQRSQFGLAHLKPAGTKRRLSRESNPRQRIQKRPVQIEQQILGQRTPRASQHGFSSVTSMFSASSSGGRNGYMSSKF